MGTIAEARASGNSGGSPKARRASLLQGDGGGRGSRARRNSLLYGDGGGGPRTSLNAGGQQTPQGTTVGSGGAAMKSLAMMGSGKLGSAEQTGSGKMNVDLHLLAQQVG